MGSGEVSRTSNGDHAAPSGFDPCWDKRCLKTVGGEVVLRQRDDRKLNQTFDHVDASSMSGFISRCSSSTNVRTWPSPHLHAHHLNCSTLQPILVCIEMAMVW